MSFDLGDPVPLSVAIKDTSGNLANAGVVVLTITLPDGTTHVENPVSPTSTGVYDFVYETIQAGVHQARWLATGANASSYSDAFVVEPAPGMPFISLADAKGHLRLMFSDDDEALRGFVGAACQMITDRMGAVTPETVIADRSARSGVIVLPRRPVISVTSVVRLPGGGTVAAADALAGTSGWTLEHSEGVMSVPASRDMVRVTYRAGRSPLPKNFRLAALDLVRHLWQGSQHNQAGGRPALGDSDAIAASVKPYALPYRVSELLGLKRSQERDEPLVG